MNQDTLFSEREADRYFERNRAFYEAFDPAIDPPLALMKLYDIKPRSVAEVGAANGARVAHIHQTMGASALAIEPSAAAIDSGRKMFPAVSFERATAASFDPSRSFDLVIVSFVFHWVDRSQLLRSVANIDCMVADGGFLIVGDFYPSTRSSTPYHHLPEGDAFTFKQDYSEVFLASGLYHTVGLLSRPYKSPHLAPAPSQERIANILLRKSMTDQYNRAQGVEIGIHKPR